MKKISLFIMLMASMLVLSSCTEDYNADVAAPQAWEQEELTTAPVLTLTPSAAIVLDDVTEESVQLVTSSISNLPADAELSAMTILATIEGSDVKYEVKNVNGLVLVEDLQDALEAFYDRSVVARELILMATQSVLSEGEAIYLTSGDITVTVTPLEPYDPGFYYLVGGVQGWVPDDKSIIMMPIPGEDTKFTITTDLSRAEANEPNFKISVGTNEEGWDGLFYGSIVDGATDLSGALTDNNPGAIMCPTSEFYTLTIDMMAPSYTLELLADQAPVEYASIGLVGAFSGWGTDPDPILEEVAPHLWAYVGFVHAAAGELKLRADNDWTTSWGAAAATAIEGTTSMGLELNGQNLNVPAGTYNFYFNDITGHLYIIAQ